MDNENGATSERIDDFLQIFKKGVEFTQDLLNENEKLRFRIARLEATANTFPGAATGAPHALDERIQALEKENKALIDRFRAVEAENKDFANRYVEVEAENNNLANLYVAGYQLHSTLDFNEAITIILEIVMNLVGAEEFAILMLDEKSGELSIVAEEGMNPESRPGIKLGEGIIGKAAHYTTQRMASSTAPIGMQTGKCRQSNACSPPEPTPTFRLPTSTWALTARLRSP